MARDGWGICKNARNEFLFFERTQFSPFGLTIPAGHVDREDATPMEAAERELVEEVGLRRDYLDHVVTDDIAESCSSGSDMHRWYVYATVLHDDERVIIDKEEGSRPTWLTLEDAASKKMVQATEYLVGKYRDLL